MHLDDEIRYDSDPRVTFAVLRDPVFVKEVCENSGALEYTVDVRDLDGPDGAVTVRTRRELPADKIPEPAASILSGRLVVEQEEAWDAARPDGSRTGRISVTVQGTPLKFAGKLKLAASGSGSVQTLDGELKAGIPLIGKKIEKSAEPAIRKGIRAQEKTARAWLARS